jgi:hypothetical protein
MPRVHSEWHKAECMKSNRTAILRLSHLSLSDPSHAIVDVGHGTRRWFPPHERLEARGVYHKKEPGTRRAGYVGFRLNTAPDDFGSRR